MYCQTAGDMSFSAHYNSLDHGDPKGKNVFTNIGSDRIKRRPSQFDRAVHRLYSEPRHVFRTSWADRLYTRTYWILRTIQFRILYKNEELDVEESEKWEVGVKPPTLESLSGKTKFDQRWIKYMYAKFKNECPSGKMKKEEFRTLLASIIAPERATDQYIERLFLAFASEDKETITFQNLIDCLSLLHPESAESNATWTIRLITGVAGDIFAFPEFLSFTQSVFALNEGKPGCQNSNKETIQQRAETVFRELDQDKDGFVTQQDMIRFFTNGGSPIPGQQLPPSGNTATTSRYRTTPRIQKK